MIGSLQHACGDVPPARIAWRRAPNGKLRKQAQHLPATLCSCNSTCTVHDSSAVDGVHVSRLKLVCSQALKPGADTALDAAALEAIAEEAPSATLPRAQVVGATVVDVAVATGIQPSKGAARRLIKVSLI